MDDETSLPLGTSGGMSGLASHGGRSPIARKAGLDVMGSFKRTQDSEAGCSGFGSSSRPPLNPPHSDAPGPGSYLLKQRPDGPSPTLKSRTPFGSLYRMDADRDAEPGPGHYQPKHLSKIPIRHVAFPKGARPDMHSFRMAPGPGAFKLPGSSGKQVESTRHSNHPISFGCGKRPALLMHSADVGPGEYGLGVSAVMRQVNSRYRTAATIKFGTGGRHKACVGERQGNDDVPGPGSCKFDETNER